MSYHATSIDKIAVSHLDDNNLLNDFIQNNVSNFRTGCDITESEPIYDFDENEREGSAKNANRDCIDHNYNSLES